MTVIRGRGLEKSFGKARILNGIDIDIQERDIFALVGRSGAGKSTLLRCINALETYDEGSLQVLGQEVSSLSGSQLREFRKHVGMIFQQFSLTDRDTVYQNVALPMKCWKYPKAEIGRKVDRLLEIVGLADKRDQKARALSGGQKQRVAIARALTMDPKVLLCDEATSALDPNTTASILDLLREINRELGVTVVIVTHEMSVVRYICNRVAILDRSGIADVGDVETVFRNQCPALKELLGSRDHYRAGADETLLRIFISSSISDPYFLSHLTGNAGVDYQLLNANIEEYRAGTFGEVIVKVQAADRRRLTDYLDGEGIFWEVVR